MSLEIKVCVVAGEYLRDRLCSALFASDGARPRSCWPATGQECDALARG